MLLVLTGVTAISVALLAYVNELTKEPIARSQCEDIERGCQSGGSRISTNDPIAENDTISARKTE